MVKTIRKTGMTLVEIIMVVVIVGVLATLGLVNYTGVRERSMSREATANLRLVAAAERIYRMETGTFYIPTLATAGDRMNQMNNILRLSLPLNNVNWNYDVTVANANAFTAQATRATGVANACVYQVTQATAEPAPVIPANCPAQ